MTKYFRVFAYSLNTKGKVERASAPFVSRAYSAVVLVLVVDSSWKRITNT